jgi:hypothetical protein
MATKTSNRLLSLQVYLDHSVKTFTRLYKKFDRSVVCTEAKDVLHAIWEVIETINISALYLNDSSGLLVLGIIDRAEQVLYWRIQLYNNTCGEPSETYKARYESLKLSKRYLINYFLALRSGDTRLAALWTKAVQLCDPGPLDTYSLLKPHAANSVRGLWAITSIKFNKVLESFEHLQKVLSKESGPVLKIVLSASRCFRANIVLKELECKKDEETLQSKYFLHGQWLERYSTVMFPSTRNSILELIKCRKLASFIPKKKRA